MAAYWITSILHCGYCLTSVIKWPCASCVSASNTTHNCISPLNRNRRISSTAALPLLRSADSIRYGKIAGTTPAILPYGISAISSFIQAEASLPYCLLQPCLCQPTCGGLYSYFSAHASNSFALATFFSGLLGLRFKKLPFVLLFIAFLVAYSRIYIGVHYPLDILSGMAFGAIFGQLFFYSWKKILPQFVL
ncbi:MAG: phosphatase PAP2 family protein [Flavobacteriia bacterium]|nr:phosphatase PAP2 family protein [Flavobacteriia bacterium]